MAAVARCFPGKASGGGDRSPDRGEIERCRTWLRREVDILEPALVIAVGTLAIEQVLGRRRRWPRSWADSAGAPGTAASVDVVAFPHPSGASPWHEFEPGKTLLGRRCGASPASRDAALRRSERHAWPRRCLRMGTVPPIRHPLARRLLHTAAATVDRAVVAAMQMRNRGARVAGRGALA